MPARKATVYTLISAVMPARTSSDDPVPILKVETFRDMDNLKERLKGISPTDPSYELYEGEAVPFGAETTVTIGMPRKRKSSPKVEGEVKRGGRPKGSKNRPRLPTPIVPDEFVPANGAA